MESRETFSPPPRAALIFLVPGILAVLFFLDGFCSFTRIGVWLAGAALAGMSGICLLWKRSRSLIINLAVLLTTLLFMAWIIEGVFRYALLSPKVPVDTDGFAKWVSSSWPQPIPREKPDGMFRTIGLSDSYGVAAEKNNYHCQLAQLLNQPNHPFEVVNFSVTGYQPLDQLRILETFGPSFDPDLVLHGFFVGNDFFARRGELVDLMGFPLLNFPLQELLLPRRFLLFQYAKASLALFRDNSRKKAQQTSGHPVGTFSQEEHLRVAINYFQACLKGALTLGASGVQTTMSSSGSGPGIQRRSLLINSWRRKAALRPLSREWENSPPGTRGNNLWVAQRATAAAPGREHSRLISPR